MTTPSPQPIYSPFTVHVPVPVPQESHWTNPDVLVQWMVAFATLATAVVAVGIARNAEKKATARAEADRAHFAEMAEKERQQEREERARERTLRLLHELMNALATDQQRSSGGTPFVSDEGKNIVTSLIHAWGRMDYLFAYYLDGQAEELMRDLDGIEWVFEYMRGEVTDMIGQLEPNLPELRRRHAGESDEPSS